MKRLFALILALALTLALAGCAPKKPTLPDFDPEGYVISSREEMGPNHTYYQEDMWCGEETPESPEAVAEDSVFAVKARMISSDRFDNATTEYTFDVLEDYYGTAEERIRLGYLADDDFFQAGGVYYLFLISFNHPAVPHRIYDLTSSRFVVREYLLDGETILDFYRGYDLGLDERTDMDAKMRELAEHAANAEKGPHVRLFYTYEGLLDDPGLVEIVSVAELVRGPRPTDKYTAFANYAVEEVLCGEALEPDGEPMLVPADSKAGDRFVLLFGKYVSSPARSTSYFVFPIDSEEARAVLARFS
ncbi:MAG: hypothetical protein K6F67_05995 [Oscillospiraceae bacterium]|nr:hypothetical protein [Oscillospiraceae bacterium]